MKLNPKQPFLHLLFAVILLGIAACVASPSGSETPDGSVQQATPATQPPAPAESADSDSCPQGDPNPIVQSIAETYEVSYEQVMIWFCSGYSFENILIALETGEAVDIPADALLQMLQEKEWEQIWVEVGFTEGQ